MPYQVGSTPYLSDDIHVTISINIQQSRGQISLSVGAGELHRRAEEVFRTLLRKGPSGEERKEKERESKFHVSMGWLVGGREVGDALEFGDGLAHDGGHVVVPPGLVHGPFCPFGFCDMPIPNLPIATQKADAVEVSPGRREVNDVNPVVAAVLPVMPKVDHHVAIRGVRPPADLRALVVVVLFHEDERAAV